MSKAGRVYLRDIFAGIIQEDENGFSFQYDETYMANLSARPISLRMPLQKDKYQSKYLFPFFDGLIPEGWLLDIAEKNWKINPRDRMELLLTFCRDTIGAVGVEKITEQTNE